MELAETLYKVLALLGKMWVANELPDVRTYGNLVDCVWEIAEITGAENALNNLIEGKEN